MNKEKRRLIIEDRQPNEEIVMDTLERALQYIERADWIYEVQNWENEKQ